MNITVILIQNTTILREQNAASLNVEADGT